MTNILKSRIQKNKNLKSISFSEVPPFPTKNMLIELSNACNDACIFCCNRKMTRKKGFISYTFLNRILKEAYQLGTREVGFYTTGEPLVYQDLDKCIALAKSIGYEYVYITTNGALATPERIYSIINAGLDSIKFSINAGNRLDYAFIHGKDEYYRVLENLKTIYDYKKRNNININIFVSYVRTRYTNLTDDEIKKIFAGMCDEVVCVSVADQYGLNPLTQEKLSLLDDNNKTNLPCEVVFNSLSISYEGYISCCCHDFQNYLAYADLNKVSLSEAWSSKIIREFRKAHINGDVSNTICELCVEHCRKKVDPLRKDLCTEFNFDKMFKDEDFVNRLDNYLLKNNLNNIVD